MPMEANAPRTWGRVAEFFRITGKHSLQLDEVAVPVVVLADFTEQEAVVDDAATFVMAVAADALGPSRAVLLNDSLGTRMFVDRVLYSAPSTMTCQVILSNTPPILAIAGGSADKTWNNRLQQGDPPGEMFADRGAFVGPDVYNGLVAANSTLRVDGMLIIDPGEQVVVAGSSTNVAIRVVFNVRVATLR